MLSLQYSFVKPAYKLYTFCTCMSTIGKVFKFHISFRNSEFYELFIKQDMIII